MTLDPAPYIGVSLPEREVSDTVRGGVGV